MRRDELTTDVERLAFEFFFGFSRFEFALKENGYLERQNEGAQAKAGWSKFEGEFQEEYAISAAGSRLLELAPQRQVVAANGGLRFTPDTFGDHVSNLSKVTRLLKNVRNNLFHGGKHTPVGWDDPARICELLAASQEILMELAKLGELEADYLGQY